MALVAGAMELPVPCPSPARVGSRGPIHCLIEKERPSDQPYVNQAKSAKEFVNVCREAVSISCGQPLLSYKLKQFKSSRNTKPTESVAKVPSAPKASESAPTRSSSFRGSDSSPARSTSFRALESVSGRSTAARAPESITGRSTAARAPESVPGRSMPTRVLSNAIRIAGCSEVRPGVEVTAGSFQRAAPHAKDGLGSFRKFSHDDAFDFMGSVDREAGLHADYPALMSPMQRKALIPFFRNELDAAGRAMKRRSSGQAPRQGFHRRATSLGNCSSAASSTDQKAWQSYTRDSYPPFSQAKNYSFFRLSPTGSGRNLE